MKESFSIKFIKVLLILIIFFCAGFIWKYSLIGLFAPKEVSNDIGSIPGLLFISAIYLTISWNLTKIVYSIESTPFTFKNVKSFKIIGYLMIALSFIDGISNLKKQNDFILIGTDYFSIKPSCLLYLILGLIALVLGEIFKKAVEIKNENDLTI